MLLGFAITQHCNLRCPHCIRDDVTTVRSLPLSLVQRITDEALELYGEVTVSLTGGEPMVHPDFGAMLRFFGNRQVPYRFVTNGWHTRRVLPVLERHPPQGVRLSLSGADRSTHDAERGRGSFDRVLLSVGLLASRGIPALMSIVIDNRDIDQVEAAAELAESLGCVALHFILPQPVPASVARGSDLPPAAWPAARDRVVRLASVPGRRTRIILDYGAPFPGAESPCATLSMERIYVDAHGRICTCCQLSDYGGNEAEVVADLNQVSLAEAHGRYVARLDKLRRATQADPTSTDPLEKLPCIRCARVSGKMDWVRSFPDSPWHGAAVAGSRHAAVPTLVQLRASA
jgi:MoaA/NifB/PqqE/SkfB family radical SAM enzyme